MGYKAKAIGIMNDINMFLVTLLATRPAMLLADGSDEGATTDTSGTDGISGCDLSKMEVKDGKLTTGCSSTNMEGVGNHVLEKEHTLVLFVIAIAAGIMTIIFVIKAVNLAKSGDNPQERSRAIAGLIVLFIAIALLGGYTLFSALAYNLLG
jgi:hypothetical protein